MDWFARQLLDWYDRHGRKDLPWQQRINPYRVWVSEIMLQQTQVTTVIPYYERFMERFPTVADLAEAALDDVLHHWSGLGYYARARNLHKAANAITAEHGGVMPTTVDALETLPGIGRSTAGAIVAIAHGRRAPILDGNVKRVLARFHAVEGDPGTSAVARSLWALAEEHTPGDRSRDYTQAIMDLGATLCKHSAADCASCPLMARCKAQALDAVERFPGRKPRVEKPVREARLFMLHDGNGGCLLEQRPGHGVWGGLWTPPERPMDTSAEDFLQALGLHLADNRSTRIGARFRHTFSHFHLDIEPVYIEVAEPPRAVADRDDVRWFVPGQNEAVGLSAPAARLIESLQAVS